MFSFSQLLTSYNAIHKAWVMINVTLLKCNRHIWWRVIINMNLSVEMCCCYCLIDCVRIASHHLIVAQEVLHSYTTTTWSIGNLHNGHGWLCSCTFAAHSGQTHLCTVAPCWNPAVRGFTSQIRHSSSLVESTCMKSTVPACLRLGSSWTSCWYWWLRRTSWPGIKTAWQSGADGASGADPCWFCITFKDSIDGVYGEQMGTGLNRGLSPLVKVRCASSCFALLLAEVASKAVLYM